MALRYFKIFLIFRTFCQLLNYKKWQLHRIQQFAKQYVNLSHDFENYSSIEI